MNPIPHSWIPPRLEALLRKAPELQKAFLVGGCVRDALLGTDSKDFDIEVFGADYAELARGLAKWGRVDLVGKSFGVVKLTVAPGETYDFSLPRRDSKVGAGHTGFVVQFDPGLEPRQAAARRDFTINSLMWDPREGVVLDFFGGQSDLAARILRHTSSAFTEDPLRVLRGMQFAGRFGLTPAPETIALSRSIQSHFGELAVERVLEEWLKWASRSVVPSAGLQFLEATGWLEHFPEIAALRGVEQDPEWHPEGDVWVHTLHCLDALVRLPFWRGSDAETRVVLSMATLSHDLGKPSCTRIEPRGGRDRIVSPGHEAAGGPLTEAWLRRIGLPSSYLSRIIPLVENHLAHLQEPTARAIRRLAHRLAPATIEELVCLMTADASGRPPKPAGEPPGATALKQAAELLTLTQSAPKPLLLGRHLIERGMTPGPEFAPILAAAFQAQLDGLFVDVKGAQAWLDQTQPATGEPSATPAPFA